MTRRHNERGLDFYKTWRCGHNVVIDFSQGFLNVVLRFTRMLVILYCPLHILMAGYRGSYLGIQAAE